MVAKIIKLRITLVIAVAPAVEFVACWNISMKGKPVGEVNALSMSPMQKRMAISIEKPRVPFMAMEVMSDCGTTVEALRISSHIWTAPSAPFRG